MQDLKDTGDSEAKIWTLFIIILILMHFTAPFKFDRPQRQAMGALYIDASTSIEYMEQGNKGRQIALLILGFGSILSLVRKERKSVSVYSVAGWFLIGYLLICTYSVAWSGDVSFVAKRLFKLLLICLGALAIAERFSLRKLLILFVLIGFIPVVLSFTAEFYYGTFDPFDPYWRFGGGFHPISLGYHCGIVLIAIQPLVCTTKGKTKLLLNIIMAVAFLAILLTKSRTPFVASMIGLVFARYFFVSHLDRVKFILLGMVGVSILVLLMGEKISISDLAAMGRSEETKEMTGSLSGRSYLWGELLKFAAEKPMIGWGYDAFLGPRNIGMIYDQLGWAPSNTHSDYINAIVGTGYIGFLFMISFFVGVVIRAAQLVRRNYYYGVFLGLAICIIINSSMDAMMITSSGWALVLYAVYMKVFFLPVEPYEEQDER